MVIVRALNVEPCSFFFFNATATTEIYTLSLHDALPILLAVADHRRSADTRRVISRLDQQLRRAATEQARLDALLHRPENAEVLERSLFLNSLLYRKSISWTKVFEDLEKVLPPNVRLINIRPQVVSESQVYLEMTLGSDSLPPVIE